MQVCSLTESGQGGGKIYVNVDRMVSVQRDSATTASSSSTLTLAVSDFIPAQPDRSVDAEPGLAWDRTGGPHNGRVYLVYTLEHKNESDNTDVYVRYSDDEPVRPGARGTVNDDASTNSQFCEDRAPIPRPENLAVSWYDARNDLGTGEL